jgi:hypothetical protein
MFGGNIRWRVRRMIRPLRRRIVRRLYRDDDPTIGNCILVAGAARSGTTWLGDLVAGTEGRVLFEPFHSGKVADLRGVNYFQYLRPQAEHQQLQTFSERVFSGRVGGPWIDREVSQLRPTYRVVKEIRANLFLKWLHRHFPEVPQVFIVRHPCAVVLSRLQLGWATDSDVAAFVSQTELVEDHLAPHLDLIGRAKTDAEKHAIIWCISQLVPLRQFEPSELNLVFYEDLVLHPHRELARVERIVARRLPASPADVAVPSATANRSSGLTGMGALLAWKRRLPADQVRQVLDTVESFGLGGLYHDAVPAEGWRQNHAHVTEPAR